MTKKLLIFSVSKLCIAFFAFASFNSCDKLPKGVNISDIRGYYFENNYLDNRVKAINDAIGMCSGDCETFFWITDMHWEPDLNTRQSPLLIKYIATKTGINKILNGGDTGNSQIICKNAISQLRSALGSNKVYSVNGNHEMNDASRYERPFLRVADELRGHCSDLVYGDDNQSYFYFDNIVDKTRYIGLSTFGLYLNGKYESCFTAEQLTWFKQIALNVHTGWTIIVFSHSLYGIDPSSELLEVFPADANGFIEAIDSYKGDGVIACVLMGDSHRDRLHIGDSGVPYIISACDRHAIYHNDINVDRIPGTISEQHFEVVVIDKGSKKIELFSIGANARDGYDNNPGKEVDVRIVNY